MKKKRGKEKDVLRQIPGLMGSRKKEEHKMEPNHLEGPYHQIRTGLAKNTLTDRRKRGDRKRTTF